MRPRWAVMEAPAKVNLRLRVLERQESGFHELETLFLATGLCDQVQVTVEAEGSAVSLEVHGAPAAIGPPERNLVVRAARAYLRASDWQPGLRLRLSKRIPAAAGLGGGSSDAAAALRLLEALAPAPLGAERLRELALELGSDVPFFLSGSPFALARGRGERLEPLPPLPARPLLVAHPGVELPTSAAFAELAADRAGTQPPRGTPLPRAQLAGWDGVEDLAVNDFEEVAVRRVPQVAGALDLLGDEGARITRLSGSGAAVFGVFADDAAGTEGRERSARRLAALGWSVWRTESLTEMPRPHVDPIHAGP